LSKEYVMKNYLAVYVGTPESMARWNELTPQVQAQRQASGIGAWHKWVEDNKARIVDNGGPLGKTKSVSSSGVADIRNAMTGYTVLRAENHEEAAKLFAGHPHFTIFPGDAVEIMECLPIPASSEA
jgi:hypothetical protein